jgi:hypothetical protein
MTTPSQYEKEFQNVPFTRLMCYYAYRFDSLDERDLKAYAKMEHLSLPEVKDFARRGLDQGYLTMGSYDWYGSGRAYCIRPAHALPFLHHLYTQQWDKDFERLSTINDYQGTYVNRMVMYTLRGKASQVKPAWFDDLDTDLFLTLTHYPDLYPLAGRMGEIDIFNIINETLETNLEHNVYEDDAPLLSLITIWEKKNKQELTELRDLLLVYRYMADGVYTPPASPVSPELSAKTLARYASPFRILLEALRAAVAADYSRAITLYSAYFKLTNSQRPYRNLFASPLLSYIHMMTFVHEGSDESMKCAQRYNADRYLAGSTSSTATLALYEYFTRADHRIPANYLEILWRAGGTYRQLADLLTHYIQDASTRPAGLPAEQPRYALLRHEMASFLPLTDEERARLDAAYGTHPLLFSIPFKAPWEYALEDLLSAQQTDAQNREGTQSTRMMYLIRYNEIEPREQSRLKSGAWSSGRAISTQRYCEGQIDCMDEADRRIWNQFRRGGYRSLSPEIVMPELVDTDRVCYGRNAPYKPVRIVREKPYLTIERGRDSFTVHANYEAKKGKHVYTSPTHIVTERADDEYVVTAIEGVQRRFFEGLLRVGHFPLEAEARLKEFFPQVSQIIEVHSSTFAEGNTLDTVQGDATLYLQASPLEDGFSLHIVVRPLPGGQLTFVPGQGPAVVPDEAQGQRLQVQRPLKEEKRRLTTLAALVNNLTDCEVREGSALLGVQEMLALVEHLRPMSHLYVIEWEEGKQLNLRKTVKMDRWQVGLRRHAGWFELEGEISLDDDTVLSMAQLLDLLGNGRNEYVRLNDHDYLQLSDNLRRQLSRLEAASQHQHGRVEIPALTAGLLTEDALEGEFTVQTDEALEQLRGRITESRTLSPKVPAKLQATLRDYQLDGFQWIARLNHWGAGACLADDMGLGKTVQTIAYLLYIAKEGASLVVAPASVVPNWKRELARFAPSLQVSILNESTDRLATITQAKPRHVIVSTYGLLVSESEALTQKSWNVVCLDEAHTIKNRETKTSSVAMQLQASHRLILTGTPVQNHLGELWNLFQFINPGLLGSYEQFQQKFIQPIEGEHDKQRQQQLNRLVHPFMLRRTKREVVEELPDKEEIILPVELTDAEMSIYEVIRRKAQEMVAEGGAKVNVATLAQITKLRQAACCAELVEPKWEGSCSKIDRLVDLLIELRENGHRALVFSQFTSFFALIRKALDRASIPYLYLDGSVAVRKRQQLVDEFQEGDCPFFLISLKAGGLGLNLTGANYIIHLDPWWNPAIEQQATDRAYRIGQKQKVTAYHLVSSHTIEEKILRLHDTKRNLSDALLSGTDMSHKLTAHDLLEILEGK